MLFIHFSCFHSSSLQAFVILHLKCWLTAFHLWLKLCIILEVAMVRHDVDFFPPVSISHRVGISKMCRVYVMKPAHWTVKYSKVFCNYTTFSRSSVWIAIDFCSNSQPPDSSSVMCGGASFSFCLHLFLLWTHWKLMDAVDSFQQSVLALVTQLQGICPSILPEMTFWAVLCLPFFGLCCR